MGEIPWGFKSPLRHGRNPRPQGLGFSRFRASGHSMVTAGPETTSALAFASEVGPVAWIGSIVVDPEVETKLRIKHGLTGGQVEAAVAFGGHTRAAWDDHPVYGRRLVVVGSDSSGEIIAYLKPLDESDGLWECLTAWRL